MKKILPLLTLLFLVLGCSKPGDCVESTGDLISKEFTVPEGTKFDKIIVYSGIALVVAEGPYKIEVKTGENLIDDIEVKIADGLLSLRDNTTCNWVREYGQTTVYVTAPNIMELHSKTEKTISSNGVLTNSTVVDGVLPTGTLRLFSMDLTDGAGTGDFNIQVDNVQTVIENNNVARYYISGQTDDLLLNFYDGNGRFEGENLSAKEIKVFHRGSNDMIVKATDKIWGKMVSTGNIILKNTPTIVAVEELYHGRVIYN